MEKSSTVLLKEEFIKIIQEYDTFKDRIDKISKAGLQIWNSELVEYSYQTFDRLLKALFTEEGVDWVYWWLLEKRGNPEFKAFDENQKEIPSETIEDLWNVVKQYRIIND